jgi:hypothetical protein
VGFHGHGQTINLLLLHLARALSQVWLSSHEVVLPIRIAVLVAGCHDLLVLVPVIVCVISLVCQLFPFSCNASFFLSLLIVV